MFFVTAILLCVRTNKLHLFGLFEGSQCQSMKFVCFKPITVKTSPTSCWVQWQAAISIIFKNFPERWESKPKAWCSLCPNASSSWTFSMIHQEFTYNIKRFHGVESKCCFKIILITACFSRYLWTPPTIEIILPKHDTLAVII